MPNTNILISTEFAQRSSASAAIDENTDLIALVANAPSSVIIEVPVFTDGKVFSISKQLRYLGFTGEIIVSGNFIVDQVGYLSQCGISTFLVNNKDQQEEVERLLAARIDSYHFKEKIGA
ncbi:DUF934 domain-containing protein [uncultured Umboniibacter sp.]|uniref:DUF934 domain-containing protein n=1 Tax=uncultured Umboniibacter sp. TaxID=1798917 RepID=UPI00260C095A|nr:DUF934 domain-containing protein [uncultured Umboniibacter sp.]